MEATPMRNNEAAETSESQEKVWTARRRVIASNTAEAFRGTKHVNRLALPGEGVDCIHFVMAVLEAAEIVPRFQLPFYDERLGSFRARNVMEDLFNMHFHVSIHQPINPPEFGDVVICKCGRQANHVGIVLDGWLWHVPANGYCIPEDWGHWQHRVQSLIRFNATGLKADPNGLRWSQIKGLADRPL
jgi:cell wall-associated NlpC family hydrolase